LQNHGQSSFLMWGDGQRMVKMKEGKSHQYCLAVRLWTLLQCLLS